MSRGRYSAAQVSVANHESPRTTKLYDRTNDAISLVEIERILICGALRADPAYALDVRHEGPTGRNPGKDSNKMKYRVHRFNIKMTDDQGKLEEFLNSLEGEVVAIVPNVALGFFWAHRVDFVLIVEKLA